MDELDIRIEKILLKYLGEKKVDINNINILGEIIRNKVEGKNFIIWGTGEHTEQLHKYFSHEIKDVKYFVDSDKSKYGNRFLNKNIKSIDYLREDTQIEVIIISSQFGEKDILERIRKENIECEVIAIYKELKSTSPFYIGKSAYDRIFELKELFDREGEIDCLKKLIVEYLSIRDIKNTLKNIDIYLKISREKMMLELKEEILKVVFDIKEILNQKENLNLIFLDSLRYKDIDKMKYIKEISDKNMRLERMYSIGITTYESIPGTMEGKYLFERKSDLNYSKEEDCKLIKYLKDNGYQIGITTIDQWKIIECENATYYKANNISIALWNAIKMNYKTKGRVANLIYGWHETHAPHICGNHKKKPIPHYTPFTSNTANIQTSIEYSNQYYECLKYVDEQIEFFYDLIGKNDMNIIFSDHGQIIEQIDKEIDEIGTLAGWHSDRYHIPFIAFGGGIEKRKYEKITSMIDFNDIILDLLEYKEIKSVRSYARTECGKIYNSIIRERYECKKMIEYLNEFTIYTFNDWKLVKVNGVFKLYSKDNEDVECLNNTIRDKLIKIVMAEQ